MDFNQNLDELLKQCNKFIEIHNNSIDSTKYIVLADKIESLVKVLSEINSKGKANSAEDSFAYSEEGENIHVEETDNLDTDTDEDTHLQELYSISGTVGKNGDNTEESVILVQSLLNRHGADIGVDGDCGGLTIKAINNFQEARLGSKTGLIEPDSATMKALFFKPDTIVEGQEEMVTTLGVSGKLGNTITAKGKYIISTPPNPTTSYPLVLLFSGKGQSASSLMKQVPDVYYLKAVMVFSPPNDSFAAASAVFHPLLTEKDIAVSTISICGYSLGGQAAYNSYNSATKAVGLIDPTTYYKNLDQIDSKAVLSCNPNIWGFSAKKPGDGNYLVKHCLEDAVKIATEKGGLGEISKVPHGKYPQYFLSKFKSRLI